MAEWSKAAVLKTVEGYTSVGSNPTPSANTTHLNYLKSTLFDSLKMRKQVGD